MATLTAKLLSGDPAFRALNGIGLDLIGRQVAATRNMVPDALFERLQHSRRLKRRVRALQREKPQEVPRTILAETAALLGLEPEAFRAHVETVQRHVGALLKAWPELETLDGPSTVAVVREALAILGTEKAAMAILEAGADKDDQLRCLNLCNAVAASFLLLASLLWVIAVAACAVLILIIPLFVLCIAAASADLVANIALALDIRNSCEKNCLEIAEG